MRIEATAATARSRTQRRMPADFLPADEDPSAGVDGDGPGSAADGMVGTADAASGLELDSGIKGSLEAVAIFIQITRNRGFLHLRGIANVDKACSQLSIGPECATWFDERTAEGLEPRYIRHPAVSYDRLVMPLSVHCSVTRELVQ